jgi:hypothetical protein
VQYAASSGKGDSNGYGVKQVTEASSNALQEIYNGLSVLPIVNSDVIMLSNRRVNKWGEIIYFPEGVQQYVLNNVKFAANCRGVYIHNQVQRRQAYGRWWRNSRRNFYTVKIVRELY